MKTGPILLLAAFATATSASAADMALKAAPARPGCAAAQWQGGYIGVHGGGVNYTANRTDLDEFLEDASTYVQKSWGGVVGGHLGYNWAAGCNTVWGFEVDGSWLSAKRTTHVEAGDVPGNGAPGEFLTSRLDALVSARLRTGVALDNVFLYLTGGLAGARIRTTWNDADETKPESFTFKEWRLGWVAGFGTEWAWSPQWSLRSEVLYYDFKDRNHSAFSVANTETENFVHSDTAWVSRIGLTYKWGTQGY